MKNLWVKKEGKVIKNPLRPLTDINKLPYIDYDIWGKKRLGRPMFGKIYTMIHVEIDRGCPNNCTYCAAPVLRNFFREQGVACVLKPLSGSGSELIFRCDSAHDCEQSFVTFLVERIQSNLLFDTFFTMESKASFLSILRFENNLINSINCRNLKFH